MAGEFLCLACINEENMDKSIAGELAKYSVGIDFTAKNLYTEFKRSQPAVIIADTDIPGVVQDLKSIRAIGDVPVIILTENNNTVDRLVAFKLGCDDYILYECDYRETAARVNAVLKRCYKKASKNDDVVIYDSIMINRTTYEVVMRGKPFVFPPKELELLYCLAAAPNKVFTREQLLDRVWGYDYYGDTRTVDVHIERIRRKIKPYEKNWRIKTVYGVGYKFEIS